MFGRKKVIDNLTTDQTKGYRTHGLNHSRLSPEDLPLFRLQYALTMTADPVVQFGLHVRDSLISAAEVEIETKNEELGKWLRKQWDVIWGVNWFKITQAKQWGFQGLEVLYEENATTGYLDVVGLKDFSPFDVRPLRAEGNTVGLRVKRHLQGNQGGSNDILMPKALWTSFASRWGNPFGRPILRNSYSPWWSKWMVGGSKKVTQLRMIKDAYRGMCGWYDPKSTEVDPDGNQIAWRDIIRETLENLNAGGTVVMPLAYDSNGNKRFDITDQPHGTDPRAIFDWGDRLDGEIWQGLDVPREIIEAASVGSGFSGRSIPFVVALQMIGGREFSCYLEAIDAMVLRPAAELNFGNQAVDYKIKPKNLVKIYTEMLGGSDMGGGAMGGGQSQSQGATLEEAQAPQQLAAPEEASAQQATAENEPQKEFIDVKLASGQTIKRRNPNFGKNPQFAESDIARDELNARILDAADDTDTNPTDEQKEAGNYRKGKFSMHGMRFAIENPKGTIRSGKDWQVTMPAHYGYILKTESEADGDHVDCFIGEEPDSEIIFVVDQVTANGRFDEHKCMVGFTSEKEARDTYAAAYTANWRIGPITAMTLGDFREWLKRGDTGHRLADQVHNLAFAEFDESKVSRVGKGDEGGGRFTSSGSDDSDLTPITFDPQEGFTVDEENLDRNGFSEPQLESAKALKEFASSKGKTIDELAKSSGFRDAGELIKTSAAIKAEGFSSFGEALNELNVKSASDILPAIRRKREGSKATELDPQKIKEAQERSRRVSEGEAQFAEFDESKVSRASEGTDTGGQFVGKGQTGTPTREKPLKERLKKQKAVTGTLANVVKTDKGFTLEDGTELPPHLKGKIFKGWENVRVSLDPKSDVLAKATDAKGRPQTVYNPEFSGRNAALKWDRVRELQQQFEGMRGQNRANLNGPNAEQAASLRLIMLMGVRPGSDRDTKAKTQAFGATTLQGRHVIIDEAGGVRLQFTGKKGVPINLPVTDENLAADLTARKQRSGDDGRLFDTNDTKLRKYSQTLDGGAFSPKDFRTNLGTTTAASIVAQGDPPKTEKEYKQRVKEVGKAVSELLGNTPAIALQSYVNPTVFSKWRID